MGGKSFTTVFLAVMAIGIPKPVSDIDHYLGVQSETVSTPRSHSDSEGTPVVQEQAGKLVDSSDLVAAIPNRSTAKEELLEIADATNTYSVFVAGVIFTETGVLSGDDRIELYSSSVNKGYVTKSNASGYFQFENVSSATDYLLTVTPRGMFKRYREKEVSIQPAESRLLIKLEVLPVDVLHGVVVNMDGIPVSGFRLRVRSEEKTKWVLDIVTNSIGQFRLDNVPIGGLSLSSMQGQVLSTTGYRHIGNQLLPLTLVVDEGPHKITGFVFDQYNEPVAGANVMLSWNNTEGTTSTSAYRRTITNLGGFFSIKGVGRGKHDLVVVDSSGAADRRTLNVINEFTDLTVVLTQNRLSN